ncbi:MAG: hypothetical protein RJA10_1414 [Pseudomonadota bacterium]|jgi:hypothetical protein
MSLSEHLEQLLEQVSLRVGDPAPRVYERLFAESPQLLPLFVADRAGKVRAEMFLRALDTLVDLAAGKPYAPGMIASERVTHSHHGIDAAQFDRFFHLIGEVFRDALGSGWTPAMADTWHLLMLRVAAIHGHPSN